MPADFCNSRTLDDQFPIRLKNGFKQKYDELKLTLSDDALFMGMLEFAQAGQHDFKQHKKANEAGFQYICAFNSDMVPHNDLSEDFNIQDFIRLTLTDQSPSDSLLGFQFELTKKKKRKGGEHE